MTIDFVDNTNYIYVPGCENNIREMLPMLFQSQVEDVLCAEQRYLSGGKGYLFTNGTGTGKTYVGLGVAMRFWAQGKRDIIIVVPTETKCRDWVREGAKVGLSITILNGIHDGGRTICVTTYANYYQNDEILRRDFDLVIYDESHYLNQNQQGKETSYLSKHKQVAKLPSFAKDQTRRMLPPYPHHDHETEDYDIYRLKLDAWKKQFTYHSVTMVEKTKVLFLSATPFAYHKSIKYADGSLFNISEGLDEGLKDHPAYNEPIGFEKFLVEHFGYRMRYNKVTIPETGVDVTLLERQFFEKHKDLGIMSTRVLELEVDYGRDFITVDSEVGTFINKGMELYFDDYFKENYKYLCEIWSRKFKYLYVNQLLEAVKVQEVIPRVRQHLALGRKVVIFHGYNNSVVEHPFKFNLEKLLTADTEHIEGLLKKEIERFNDEYSQYVNLDLNRLSNTREIISNAFPSSKQFNGTISKKKKHQNKEDFNDPNSDTNVLLVQTKAGREGIDLHDVIGGRQRVLINLGLPTAPTEAIQTEGRIYRSGAKSNAIYEYITLQTNFERYAFATKIAERATTAENLAMGNLARDLHTSFTEGYLNSDYITPNLEQGKGGKESDRKLINTSDYDRAKTYYFAKGKKTSKSKSKEGKDYFATPEPLGLKIVEWLNMQPNKKALEPSSGHGAIARWFPKTTNNTFIEPSYNLLSQLSINAGEARIENIEFENLSINNKFNYIAMNPPFGSSGKTAMEHVDKAVTLHMTRYDSEVGSTLIAIVPNGPSMNHRLNAFYEGNTFEPFLFTGEIILPTCTFERAGTSVGCKIIRIESVGNPGAMDRFNRIDLSYCKNIGEFFDELENINF